MRMKTVRGGQWWLIAIVPLGIAALAFIVAILLMGMARG